MKKITFWIKILIGMLLIASIFTLFYLNKGAVVSFNYIVGASEITLPFLLLTAFVSGALFAMIITAILQLPAVWKNAQQKAEIRQLTKQVDQLHREKAL